MTSCSPVTSRFDDWLQSLGEAAARTDPTGQQILALDGSRQEQARQEDASVAAALRDRTRARLADVLARSPLTGLVTLLDLVRCRSVPATPAPSSLRVVDQLACALARCPALMTAENGQYEQQLGPSGQVDAVVRLHRDIGPRAEGLLRSALLSMWAAARTASQAQSSQFLTVHTLLASQDNRAVLNGSEIVIKPRGHGLDVHVTLRRAVFVLHPGRWAACAPSVASGSVQLLSAWLDDNDA